MLQETSSSDHSSRKEASLIAEGIDDISKIQDTIQIDCCNLVLHANKIQHLQGFSSHRFLSLVEINLSSNLIRSCDLPELTQLINLEVLDLSANLISSTQDFPFLPGLKSLYLSFNQITTLEDLAISTPQLEILHCQGNKLQNLEEVLSSCILLLSKTLINFHCANNPCIDSSFIAAESIFGRLPKLVTFNDRNRAAWRALEDEDAARESAVLSAFYSTTSATIGNRSDQSLTEKNPPVVIINTPKVDDALHRFRDRLQSLSVKEENYHNHNHNHHPNAAPQVQNKIDAYLRTRNYQASLPVAARKHNDQSKATSHDYATSTSDLLSLQMVEKEVSMIIAPHQETGQSLQVLSSIIVSTEIADNIRKEVVLHEAARQVKAFVSMRRLASSFRDWRSFRCVEELSRWRRSARAATEEVAALREDLMKKEVESSELGAQKEQLVAEEKARAEEHNRRMLHMEAATHSLRRELESVLIERDRMTMLQQESEARYAESTERLTQTYESQKAEQILEFNQLLREKLLEYESRYAELQTTACQELEVWKASAVRLEGTVADLQKGNQSLETEKNALLTELEELRSVVVRQAETLSASSVAHDVMGPELVEAKRAAAELSEELHMVQQENHSAMVANGKLQRSVSSSKKRSKLLEQSLQELSAITLRQKSKLKTIKAARNALLSLVDERSCDNERLSSQLGQLQSQTTETIELLRHTGEEQATRVGELETLVRVKEKMLDDQGLLLSELKSRINALEDQKRRNVDDVREMESLLEEQKQDIFLLEEQLQHKDTIENKLNVVVSELQARLSFLESSLLVSTAGPENQSNSGSDQMVCGETKLSVDAADEMSRLKDEAAAIKSELEAKQTAVDDLTLQLALAVDAAAHKASDEQLLLRNQIVSLCAVLFFYHTTKTFPLLLLLLCVSVNINLGDLIIFLSGGLSHGTRSYTHAL